MNLGKTYSWLSCPQHAPGRTARAFAQGMAPPPPSASAPLLLGRLSLPRGPVRGLPPLGSHPLHCSHPGSLTLCSSPYRIWEDRNTAAQPLVSISTSLCLTLVVTSMPTWVMALFWCHHLTCPPPFCSPFPACFIYLVILDRDSCGLGWLQPLFTAEDNLELLPFRPLLPMCLDPRQHYYVQLTQC